MRDPHIWRKEENRMIELGRLTARMFNLDHYGIPDGMLLRYGRAIRGFAETERKLAEEARGLIDG